MFLGLSWYFIIMDFYLYSFFGWIYECTFCSIKQHKPVNRGFLIGPLLPLYGFGGTLIYVFLRPLEPHPSLLYLGGMILATVIEYLTSWGMEKIFHAQWWDYSEDPYNFEGRIALIPSMFWGFLSLLAFDLLQPAVTAVITWIPLRIGYRLLTAVTIITCIDLVYTVITTLNFRTQLESLYRFRNELLEQLSEEERFFSLRMIISSRLRPGERIERFWQKMNELKAAYAEDDSRLAEIESRFREYCERHMSFLQKNPLLGAGRIMQAFPTLKFIPKNNIKSGQKRIPVKLRDFILSASEKKSASSGQDTHK